MAKKREKSSGEMGCLLPIILVILIIVFIISQFFGGLGSGNGKGGKDDNPPKETVQTDDEDDDDDDVDKEEVLITVVKNDYFYKNERISLDDFFLKLADIENEFVVKVKDDSASKDAYTELIELLEDRFIDYIEEK